MNELRVDGLCYAYENKEILKDVSFSVGAGEYVYILGPNGVGKSTLFKCMLGHLKANKGSVWIGQKEVKAYSSKALAKKVAYISQSCHPHFNYTVLQLAMMGRTAHLPTFSSPKKEDYEKTYEVLERLGLQDKADCGTWEISGGERQLVMIARALVQEAEILLMDEPTSNLDFGNQIRIQTQMKKLAEEGLLIIQSSHNPQHAVLFGDKVIALHEGKVVGCGKSTQVVTPNLLYKLYGIKAEISGNMIMPIIE